MAFEEYDTPETRTENGVAAMPGGSEAAWFKDSEGRLVPAARAGPQRAACRLRAGDLATAVKRDGQDSNS